MQSILTLIDQLSSEVSAQSSSPNTSSTLNTIRRTEIEGLERSPVRVHLFEWSPLSLGWYESLLWSFIFSTEMALFKGAPSVWKGTNIRLFRVQETAAQGPSLINPQGAVDAVGSTLVKRIGSLSLRGGPQKAQPATGGAVRDL